MSSTDRQKRAERGSAMLLIPAAVLIVVLFAAVALDSAEAFLVQRELAAAADAMANDAIAGIDPDLVFTGAGAQIDDVRLVRLVTQSLSERAADLAEPDVPVIRRLPGDGVEIELGAAVRPFFGRLLHPGGWKVRATARAFPRQAAP